MTVKTIQQLKEGFKALSERLHHSKSENEAWAAVEHSPIAEPTVSDSKTKESTADNVPEDRSVSQLEKWSDDELAQAKSGFVGS